MPNMAEIIVRLDDETKEQASQVAGAMGLSLNKYIERLINADISSMPAQDLDLLRRMKHRQVTALRESSTEYKVAKSKK